MSAFDGERFAQERLRIGAGWGERISVARETGSTNDDALAAARDGAPHGMVFVADHQRAGRGRGGNQWLSAPGENLTFSALLRPELPAQRAPHLTLAVGLAIRDTVARLLPERAIDIKWPNDVWADRRKIAGVLLESTLEGGRLTAVVAGVGVNVASTHFDDSVPNATSFALLGSPPPRESLLAELLQRMEGRVAQVIETGVSALLPELRAHDALLGRRLRVDAREGVAAGWSDDGELLLQRADGVFPVRAGHVELLDQDAPSR